MVSSYRSRLEDMHALHSTSRSSIKRAKCDATAYEFLRKSDKRMLGMLSTRWKLAGKDLSFSSGKRGLQFITTEDMDGSRVLKRKYRIRVTEAENPELENYKMNVLAATSGKLDTSLQLKDAAASSSSPEPVWKVRYTEAKKNTPLLEVVDRNAALLEAKLKGLQVTRKETWEASAKRRLSLEKQRKSSVDDAFTRLSDEAEAVVKNALYSKSRNKVLAMHDKSNIEITGAIMECLRPGTWLNDEVINVYMELLKEREAREPEKFLRCHFFNTFFYNKLFKDKERYDYKAVRRWTTQKKLGYSLLDCDKVFVPIHKDIHWCLGIINLREQKFEYLDSLKGVDEDVLDVLSNYIVDEARDKAGRELDVSAWIKEYPEDIPSQKNGCDCGMFMIKYADFYSRGNSLSFSQGDMEYFRRRTAWEILRLEAR